MHVTSLDCQISTAQNPLAELAKPTSPSLPYMTFFALQRNDIMCNWTRAIKDARQNTKRTDKENLPLSSLSSIFDSNAAHLFKPRSTAEAC